jgi:(p)ppGpp synthase/HD superfamily hydrolase
MDEAAEALTAVAPAQLAWPTVFDEPHVVERVWSDFVAHLPDEERTALRQALAFARARHGSQTRTGSQTPYWVHLVRVAMEVARWGLATPELLAAALLHDVVEDTSTTIDEVEAGFGREVASAVAWLTCPTRPEAAVRDYYARLADEAPDGVKLVKLADRTDNLRSIQALVMRTGRHRRWAGNYLARTVWQVLPLAASAPSVARVGLVTAMSDLAPLVDEDV